MAAWSPTTATRVSDPLWSGNTPSLRNRTTDAAAACRTSAWSSGAWFLSAPDVGRTVEGSRAVESDEKPAHRIVEVSHRHAAVFDQGGDAGTEGPSGAGHLEVQPSPKRGPAVRHGEPISHDEALEPPFVAQEIDEEFAAARSPSFR